MFCWIVYRGEAIPCLDVLYWFYCGGDHSLTWYSLRNLRETYTPERDHPLGLRARVYLLLQKKPKKIRRNKTKQTPRCRKKDVFCRKWIAWNIYIAQIVYIWKHYICIMEILIINRISNGLALGWTYYDRDEDHDYEELTIHIAILDLRFMW